MRGNAQSVLPLPTRDGQERVRTYHGRLARVFREIPQTRAGRPWYKKAAWARCPRCLKSSPQNQSYFDGCVVARSASWYFLIFSIFGIACDAMYGFSQLAWA